MGENRTIKGANEGEDLHTNGVIDHHKVRVLNIAAFLAMAESALVNAGAIRVGKSDTAKRLTDDLALTSLETAVDRILTKWPPFIHQCSLGEEDVSRLMLADLRCVIPVVDDVAGHKAITVSSLRKLSGRGESGIYDAISKGTIKRIGRRGTADLLNIADVMVWCFRQPGLPRDDARRLQLEVLWRIMLLDPTTVELPDILPKDPHELGMVLPPVTIPVPQAFATSFAPLGTGELKLIQGMLIAQMNRVMSRQGGPAITAHRSVHDFVGSRFPDNAPDAEAVWFSLLPSVTCPECHYVGRFRRVGKGRLTLEVSADEHDLATIGTGDEWSSDASRETGFRRLADHLLVKGDGEEREGQSRGPAKNGSMELRCSRCRHEFRLSLEELKDFRRTSLERFEALRQQPGVQISRDQFEVFLSGFIHQYKTKTGFFACLDFQDIARVLGRSNTSVAHGFEQAYHRLGRHAPAGTAMGVQTGKRDPIYWAGKNAWWIWANAYWFTWQLLGTTGLARCRYAFPNLIDGMVNAFLAKFVTGEIPFDDYEREGGKLKWF